MTVRVLLLVIGALIDLASMQTMRFFPRKQALRFTAVGLALAGCCLAAVALLSWA